MLTENTIEVFSNEVLLPVEVQQVDFAYNCTTYRSGKNFRLLLLLHGSFQFFWAELVLKYLIVYFRGNRYVYFRLRLI